MLSHTELMLGVTMSVWLLEYVDLVSISERVFMYFKLQSHSQTK